MVGQASTRQCPVPWCSTMLKHHQTFCPHHWTKISKKARQRILALRQECHMRDVHGPRWENEPGCRDAIDAAVMGLTTAQGDHIAASWRVAQHHRTQQV